MYMSYGRYDICMVFRVARHVESCICHNDHKTYTWNDVILYKRSMIRVFIVKVRASKPMMRTEGQGRTVGYTELAKAYLKNFINYFKNIKAMIS